MQKVWRRQRQWSALADVTARKLAGWRLVNLALVVVGALCGALATQAGLLGRIATVAIGVGGAIALAGAAFVQTQYLNADRVRNRVRARAVSESIKSLVYQRLVDVAPFDGPGSDEKLGEAVAKLEAGVSSLAGSVLLVEVEPTPVPAVATVADYIALRAMPQRAFHFDKIEVHERLGSRWRAAELVGTLSAALLSAVGGALPGTDVSAWVGVATTIAAALAAHLAGTQHARIAARYGVTVAEIDRIMDRFDPATATGAQAAEFVAGVEGVLAAQNDTWITTLEARS